MHVVTADLLRRILDGYALPLFGLHGVGHWARVLENGVRLAEAAGGDVEVVQLFAVFHDSRRVSDGHDPDHGPRGAELALAFREAGLIDVDDPAMERLYVACERHTHQRHHDDVTVQCCFDADRLDLGRVYVRPKPEYLNTELAKQREILDWAWERSDEERIPEFVETLWEIDMGR